MSEPPAPPADGPTEENARSRRPSRHPPMRDMEVTAFAKILGDLVARLPGAFASALVDLGGETVDYAGVGDIFDVKVAAAHVRILLNDLETLGTIGVPRSLIIRGEKRTLIGRRLPEGYALVVLLRRRAGFVLSERAFAVCEWALTAEAGWTHSEKRPGWYPAAVQVRRGRPISLGSPPSAIEIIGTVVGLPSCEKGFRVRVGSGGECTLVREAGNAWYADEDLREIDTQARR